MLALVSALAMTLAGPGSVAPPLAPTADSDAIYAAIVAGDPTLTGNPAPLEQLLAATELAEEKLYQATDPADVDEFLTLTAQGRMAAYGRTGEPHHMCRLLSAAEQVLARESITPGLSASASDFRRQAQGRLGARPCAHTPRREQSTTPPAGTTPGAETAKPTVGARTLEGPLSPLSDRHDRRRVRAGLGTLASGLVLLAPMAGILAYRAAGERDFAALNLDAAPRTPTEAEYAEADALGRRYTAATAGTIVLGVTAGALIATGATLLAIGPRPRRMSLTPWGARGLGGLVLQGRF